MRRAINPSKDQARGMDRRDDWLFFFLSHNDFLRDFGFVRFGLYEYLSTYDTVFGRQADQAGLLGRHC